MSVLGIFTQTKVERLQERSADALSVFRTTINNLKDVNTSVQAEVGAKSEAILKLEREKETLIDMAEENAILIEKISEFFKPSK